MAPRRCRMVFAAALCCFASPPLQAEDIEIYTGAAGAGGVNPNVLFIVDAADERRLSVAQAALKALLDELREVNVGLLRFGGGGAELLQPVDYIDRRLADGADGEAAMRVRHRLQELVADLKPARGGAIADALYRAARHYTGAGDSASPVAHWCQTANHIILLTGGDMPGEAMPMANHAALSFETNIEQLINASCENSDPPRRRCAVQLARHLRGADLSSLREIQHIQTHIVDIRAAEVQPSDAPAPDSPAPDPWLQTLAAAGGGQYRNAANASELAASLQRILSPALSASGTLVAPVMAASEFPRLQHRGEAYFAMFRPSRHPTWLGNLKKYQLRAGDNALVDFADPPQPALDPATGLFSDRARSGWSGMRDGGDAAAGGANARVPDYNARNIYTWHAGAGSNALSDSRNHLSRNNRDIIRGLFEQEDSAIKDYTHEEFGAFIDWLRGKDAFDEDGDSITAENRHIIADPLHSRPAAIAYGSGDAATPDIRLFFGANAGFLHAVDAATGAEQFAFIPAAMYSMQRDLRANLPGRRHLYGLDGTVTAWTRDADGDGIIAAGDSVRIYFGMRRGGRNYYALDVSDRDHPAILWMIEGGAGDFPALGQTWGRPVPGVINVGGRRRDVLYLSGGYDPAQDDTLIRAADRMGNALYIVDAATGEPIWSAGGDPAHGAIHTETLLDMAYSFPATPAVADVDASGADDMLFIGDTGGQLWRCDIHNGAAAAELISCGVIADLGAASGPNRAARNRRFYHSPDLALLREWRGAPALAVMLGSGYRAHPLSLAADDRFYMIRQTHVFNAPARYRKVTEGMLLNVGAGASGTNTEHGASAAARAALNASHGWYFDLPNPGEKVLSAPLAFRGTVAFTTYQPGRVRDACAPAAGTARIYHIAIEDARPANQWAAPPGPAQDARSRPLRGGGIVDELVFACTGAGCELFAGAEKAPINTRDASRLVKTFWRKDR